MNLGDERLDAVAAAYVLGTLRGPARTRFERLARSERRVADAQRRWEDRLLPLAEGLSPVPPPAHVWSRIQTRIQGTGGRPQQAAHPAGPGWWRGLALASLALALVLAVALLKPTERPEGSLVIILAGQDAKPALIASTDRSSHYLTIAALAPVALAGDRALELWLLPDHGNPRSLGLVSAIAPGGMARIGLPASAEQTLQNIPALAVSLEPQGGSPTGLPTGPVLYSGPVRRLY